VIAQIEALAEASGEGGHLNEDQQSQAAELVESFAVEGGKASSQLAFVLIKDEGLQIAEKIEAGAEGVIHGVEGLVDRAIDRVKGVLGGESNAAPETPASPEIAAAASASSDSSAASTSAPADSAPADAPADHVESQPQS
jgi:hypothetical protein